MLVVGVSIAEVTRLLSGVHVGVFVNLLYFMIYVDIRMTDCFDKLLHYGLIYDTYKVRFMELFYQYLTSNLLIVMLFCFFNFCIVEMVLLETPIVVRKYNPLL